MTCHGKRRYDSWGQAAKIVDQARDRRKRGELRRAERRAYPCRACCGWHVTSH